MAFPPISPASFRAIRDNSSCNRSAPRSSPTTLPKVWALALPTRSQPSASWIVKSLTDVPLLVTCTQLLQERGIIPTKIKVISLRIRCSDRSTPVTYKSSLSVKYDFREAPRKIHQSRSIISLGATTNLELYDSMVLDRRWLETIYL